MNLGPWTPVSIHPYTSFTMSRLVLLASFSQDFCPKIGVGFSSITGLLCGYSFTMLLMFCAKSFLFNLKVFHDHFYYLNILNEL